LQQLISNFGENIKYLKFVLKLKSKPFQIKDIFVINLNLENILIYDLRN